MDGRGRWMDNVFIERLWRSLKYEDVYLKSYADGREAARGIAEWIAFYNDRRPHQALADRMPMAVWREGATGAGCGHGGQRFRVAHMPTAATADAASRCVIERNDERSDIQLRNRLKRSRCAGPLHMFSRRKACRGKNQNPVVWIAGWRETKTLKAYRQRLPWGGDESPGRNNSERKSGLESE